MVFSKKVKSYKVNARFVKSVGAEVMNLGFPASEVDKGNLCFNAIKLAIGATSFEAEDNRVVFSIHENIKENYAAFLKDLSILKDTAIKVQPSQNNNTCQSLIGMIQAYDLANHTPMQSLTFVQELKNVIKSSN
jgi:hypothetical protein